MLPTSNFMIIIVTVACSILLAFHRFFRDPPIILPEKSTKSNEPLNSSYILALEDSLGFFDNIEISDWEIMRNQSRSEQLFKNPDDPDIGLNSPGRWIFENVDPVFTCPRQRRIGGRGDGGKWVCDPHRLSKTDDCLIYSIGSNGDYTFEDSLFNLYGKHCEIHVFDPSPRYGRLGDVENKNIHYHPWGLKSSYDDPLLVPAVQNLELHAFPEVLEKLGHTGRRIDMFKIDCDGCEWSLYHDWISESVDIKQILIEIHVIKEYMRNVTITGFFNDLINRGFVPFSKEANTACNPPICFEYSFLRMKPSFYLHKD